MHGVPRPAHERMPLGEIATVGEELIRTSTRQPLKAMDFLRVQDLAVLHEMNALRVVAAAAGFGVEEATSHIRKSYFSRILVLDLVETTLPTAIAKAFPLRAAHLREGFFFPKGQGLGIFH